MAIKERLITDRRKWLAWRRSYLCASEIAAAAGLKSHRSKLSLWLEKTGRLEPEAETEIMRRGRWLEAAAFAALAELKPDWELTRGNVFYSDEETRLAATPDGFAIDFGRRLLLEIKVVAEPIVASWENELPLGFELQATAGRMLTGADDAVVVVLVTSTFNLDVRLFPVRRIEGLEARIIDTAAKFWSSIALGLEPAPDHSLDHELVVKLNPPVDTAPALDLSGDNELPELLEERAALNAEHKHIEARLKEIRSEIVAKLNGATQGFLNGWRITNKITHKGEVITPAIDYPVLRVTRIDDA